ncbi:MAG TPA: PSD1 and planctomycete cytochrome C domain-containing protein [Pirellulales bacterium]|nr:PSD1 and planctomycete cytochrome C domain-containing protein [Pirellulales bacterium]
MGRILASVILAVVLLAPQPSLAADGRVLFNRDIRPILTDNCLQCHGPDKNHREADLRLDLRDEALAREAIKPGKPEESELVARIFSNDADMLMPPAKSNKSLSAEQKELLKRWIAEGAEYQGHWAYLPPVKPAVPAGANGVDHLVRQRLAKLGLTPSPEADRRTLVRRLYFDLLGLPPKPEEVDAFAADNAPDAYDRLVERLLASPHYGERMAEGWLDVVRYADTIGYHSDTPRNVYPYRDYVIQAFNSDKPFDQFTVEQLAGDLLPGGSLEQKVASCFNRLLLTTEEGGAQAKDYEARMLGDRVRAVGAVWLGQTIGCCQCHDHKFDPFTSRDFYSLGAFFADIQEPIIGAREPGMNVPTNEQSRKLAQLQAAAADAQRELDAPLPELDAAQAAWELAIREQAAAAESWTLLHPEKIESEKGVQFKVEPGETVFADRAPQQGIDTYRVTVKTPLKQITGFQLDALSRDGLPQRGPGRAANGNFVLGEFSVADAEGKPLKFTSATANFEQAGFAAAAAIDGKAEANNGWATAGMSGAECAIRFELETPLAGPAEGAEPLTLTFTLQQLHGDNHVLGKFRIWAATAAKPLAPVLAVMPPPEVVEIVKLEPAQRNEGQQATVANYFQANSPTLIDPRAKLAAARQAASDFENSLPKCLASNSGNPRVVRILPRGNWLDESGEVVKPALPAYLTTGFQANAPATDSPEQRLTRLDLARWVVSRDNPLTARVTMNRLWKQFFGIGLSKSLDDLGSQGEWPANPELLDWLACEFMDSGWDVKHMARTIVASAAYRQTSAATPELLERDPQNRELARQSRFRLDAEQVRDNALAVAGLLSPKIGGPSVKPYQPEGYWENLNFPIRQYQADHGEAQYRRGLYTWWQRSFLHPSMLAFDAPTREECAADRTRSNIPQQALVLLNDPTYVEAARAFAERIVKEGGADVVSRLTWAWRQALSRPPRDDELLTVGDLLSKQLIAYSRDPANAESLLKVGLRPLPEGIDRVELAAWTNAARVILNLHEVITRN